MEGLKKRGIVGCTKYERPEATHLPQNTIYSLPLSKKETRDIRPKDPTQGFTGFVPRHIREPVAKMGGVPYDIVRPKDKMVGFTGFKPTPESVYEPKERGYNQD
jgi:hypothetical protein